MTESSEMGADDNPSQQQQQQAITADSPQVPTVGGKIESPAFCLLAGVFADTDDCIEMISLPLTKIPAAIGRSHDSNDPHFFGLGNKKALSRQQAIIYFRDRFGGRFVEDPDNAEKLVYRKPDKRTKEAASKPVLRVDPSTDLPNEGFFVIECVGKNRIFVNQLRVDTGEVALLENGSRIRMSDYNLYFLLPKDGVATQEPLSIPNPNYKKRKAAALAPALASSEQLDNASKKQYSGGFGAVAKALEDTTAEELMVEMDIAIKGTQWERRQQMIGSAVLLHAVRDVARSPSIQQLAKENNGISRSEIMDRIKLTEKYTKWVSLGGICICLGKQRYSMTLSLTPMKLISPQVDQMLTKMEFKSYQANTSKALTKAGFMRTGTTGRHVKWILPDLGVSDDDIFAVAAGEVGKADEDDDEEENDEDAEEEDENDAAGEKDDDDQEEDDADDDDEVEELDKEKEGEDDDEDDGEEENDEMEETLETEGGVDEEEED
jgi:hypothetical protein